MRRAAPKRLVTVLPARAIGAGIVKSAPAIGARSENLCERCWGNFKRERVDTMQVLSVSSEVENILAEVMAKRATRSELRKPVTQEQLRHAVRLALERGQQRAAAVSEGRAPEPFSWTRYVRGILAQRGTVIAPETAKADVEYLTTRTLVTTTTPGSFMVPTVASDAIIGHLAQYAEARAAGARIWEMRGIQKLAVPASVASPSFVWMAQTSRQTSTDPNFGQLLFDLSMCQALVVLPAQLFKVAHPSFDVVMSDGFALGVAEAESVAMFSSSTLSNGPQALLSTAGITQLTPGSSQNGGALAFGDLIFILQKAADLKIRGPMAWFMNGRTLNRIISLNDSSSRPILIPHGRATGDGPEAPFTLFGWPVYLTASIPTNMSVGSGSNQSALFFAPPRAFHIGESGDFRMDVSFHLAFDSDEVALRLQHQLAFQYSPAAALICMTGIN